MRVTCIKVYNSKRDFLLNDKVVNYITIMR